MNTTKLYKAFSRLISISGPFLTMLYPIIFVYTQNIAEARERHLVGVVLIYALWTVTVEIVAYIVFRNRNKMLFISNVILIISLNYELPYNISEKKAAHIIQPIVLILLIYICYIAAQKMSDTVMNTILLTWSLTVIILIILNVVPVFSTIIYRIKDRMPDAYNISLTEDNTFSKNNSSAIYERETAEGLPNVYFLIFDEYGGDVNLKHYYQYDNSDFWDWLKGKGFNVSYDSYNVESISTLTNVPNVLNMDYVVDHDQEMNMYSEYINNPLIYRIMDEMGYAINTASYVAMLDNTRSNHYFDNKEYYEDTVGYYILQNSLFIYLYEPLLADILGGEGCVSGDHYGEYLISALDFYESLVYLKEGPSFNLGYFMCPHIPLVYMSDGSDIPNDKNNPSDYPEYYIEYLKWTNGRIQKIIDTILENDSGSIIILMSDHGSRSQTIEDDLILNDPDCYKKNILNCVYYKGNCLDISGMTGINTLIKVLNTEYGTSIDYKDVGAANVKD